MSKFDRAALFIFGLVFSLKLAQTSVAKNRPSVPVHG